MKHQGMSRETFLRDYSQQYSLIFKDVQRFEDGVFVSTTWAHILMPEPFLIGIGTEAALLRLLKVAGDDEIIITPVEMLEVHSTSIVVSQPETDLMGYLMSQQDYPTYESAAFGRSHRWGIYSGDEFRCLGADSELIDVFCAAAGGLDVLRREWKEFIDLKCDLSAEEWRHVGECWTQWYTKVLATYNIVNR